MPRLGPIKKFNFSWLVLMISENLVLVRVNLAIMGVQCDYNMILQWFSERLMPALAVRLFVPGRLGSGEEVAVAATV